MTLAVFGPYDPQRAPDLQEVSWYNSDYRLFPLIEAYLESEKM
jgi:hypothetical protein